ncbi:MAG TPA: erythromycin esterase family protein [Bryobacteraceae bacterium]|nr:erythromycin esterase family protein [Bryobacteraceae bacterium]
MALGEATHGTREFFQVKHRLLKFLVEQMDFSVFSIEANMPDAYRLNEFVVNGIGDPVQLIHNMRFWTWETQELLDLVIWMREFNRSGKGHLMFTGFDMGDPKPAALIVTEFVSKHDANYSDSLREALPPTVSIPSRGRIGADFHAAAFAWDKVAEHLNERRRTYSDNGVSAEDIEWVIQNATLVRQFMEMRAGEFARDDSMAQNVRWVRKHSQDGKMVIWAHNGHVAVGGGIVGTESMGTKLRRVFGDQIVAFGFAFNQGSFRAVSPQRRILAEFRVPPAPAGSLDSVLAATEIPVFLIDLRPAPRSGPVAAWLARPHTSREIGSEYPDYALFDQIYSFDVRRNFDVLVFVAKTTPTQRLEH